MDALFTAFGAAFVAMIGGASVYHALGSVIAFRSRAEPLLLANTGITSEETVRFLQLRKLLAPITRFLWTIVLNFLVLTPPQASRGQVSRVFLASILLAAIISTLEDPHVLAGTARLQVADRDRRLADRAAGHVLRLRGAGALDARQHHTPGPQTAGSGRLVGAIMNGDGGALWTLALVVAILMGLAFSLGEDVLPELYGVATKMFEKFERARSATHGVEFVDEAVDSTHIPPGVLALLWKSWIGFRRQRGAFAWLLLMCAIWGRDRYRPCDLGTLRQQLRGNLGDDGHPDRTGGARPRVRGRHRGRRLGETDLVDDDAFALLASRGTDAGAIVAQRSGGRHRTLCAGAADGRSQSGALHLPDDTCAVVGAQCERAGDLLAFPAGWTSGVRSSSSYLGHDPDRFADAGRVHHDDRTHRIDRRGACGLHRGGRAYRPAGDRLRNLAAALPGRCRLDV